jgi:hypothetical protein
VIIELKKQREGARERVANKTIVVHPVLPVHLALLLVRLDLHDLHDHRDPHDLMKSAPKNV